MTSPFYLGLMTPDVRPGDEAVDFDLPRLDGSGRVRLSDFAGVQPVALVFGSYT
jgi:peroxiredoxin